MGYISAMLSAITINRKESKRRGDGEVLDVLEYLVHHSDGEFSSPTHAAVQLIRRSPRFVEAKKAMQAAIAD